MMMGSQKEACVVGIFLKGEAPKCFFIRKKSERRMNDYMGKLMKRSKKENAYA